MNDDEMYAEMTLLVSAIARELGISVPAAAEGIEKGTITVSLETADSGERYLSVETGTKRVCITQSALGIGGGGCCQGGCTDEECAVCDEECGDTSHGAHGGKGCGCGCG